MRLCKASSTLLRFKSVMKSKNCLRPKTRMVVFDGLRDVDANWFPFPVQTFVNWTYSCTRKNRHGSNGILGTIHACLESRLSKVHSTLFNPSLCLSVWALATSFPQ